MPNRIIREGWIESDKINALSCEAERFFVRLCLRADDFGRYTANPLLLKSALFPLKPEISTETIKKLLAECYRSRLVILYMVGDKHFIEIRQFNQRTRAMKSKFPPPSDDGTSQTPVDRMSDICPTSAHGDGDGDGDGDGGGGVGPFDSERMDIGVKESRYGSRIIKLKTHDSFRGVPDIAIVNTLKSHHEAKWDKAIDDLLLHYAGAHMPVPCRTLANYLVGKSDKQKAKPVSVI